jgi:hypothetical protein
VTLLWLSESHKVCHPPANCLPSPQAAYPHCTVHQLHVLAAAMLYICVV